MCNWFGRVLHWFGTTLHLKSSRIHQDPSRRLHLAHFISAIMPRIIQTKGNPIQGKGSQMPSSGNFRASQLIYTQFAQKSLVCSLMGSAVSRGQFKTSEWLRVQSNKGPGLTHFTGSVQCSCKHDAGRSAGPGMTTWRPHTLSGAE